MKSPKRNPTPPAGRPRDRGPVRLYAACLALVVVLVVWDQLRLLTHFAFRYTDKDQVVMWTAAYEFLHGRFHEPRFYGQAYSTLLEGLVAVPFAAIGAPLNVAVPLATCLLFMTPFVALAAAALRLDRRIAATVLLALPVLLPLRGTMIAGMPRGFVGGVAFAGIAAGLALVNTSRVTTFLAALLLALSVSVSPNAAILAAPVGLFVLLERGKSRSLNLWAVPAFALGGLLHFLSTDFYRRHEANVVYGWRPRFADFNPGLLASALREPGRFVGDLVPLLPGQVWLLAAMFAAVAFGLVRWRARSAALALLAGLLLSVYGLGLARAHAGSPSIYWPWSRAYLALPPLLGLCLVWLEGAAGLRISARWRLIAPWAVAVVALACFAWRYATLDHRIAAELRVPNAVELSGEPVAEVCSRCKELRYLADRNNAELIVFNHEPEVLAYACEALQAGRTRTLLLRGFVGERRSWRVAEEARRHRRGLLLCNFSNEQIAKGAALGLLAGEPATVAGVTVTPARMPSGTNLFELLVAMDADGAAKLAYRARRLGR